MKKLFFALACASAAMMASADTPAKLTQYVDPMIGSDGHGHVFVGANVPFGLVQAGPSEPCRGWDWCSGYHYSDSVLIGFAQQHLSGTGCGDLGDISILPVTDPSTRRMIFSHDKETARAGYYSLETPQGVLAEITATERVGVHRYTFPSSADSAFVVLDLRQGIGWDGLVAVELMQTDWDELTGLRKSRGWAHTQYAYFCLQTSRPFEFSGEPTDTVAVLAFAPSPDPLVIKVGISAVAAENARANIEAEAPHWDFDRVAQEADQAWERELRKIRVESNDPARLRAFYTAMFHTMTAPSVFSDVNGAYRGADGIIRQADFTNYTTFSGWDVYRAAFPLYTLVQRERIPDFARTMLTICDEQGKLPVWHLMGCETNCMVGNPAIPILADMALKGFDIDTLRAFEASKTSMLKPERGLNHFNQYGYIPFDASNDRESVSKGMEYAIAADGAAKLAALCDLDDEQAYFENLSRAYEHYFDPATGFMRGRAIDGSWHEPFNPLEAIHENDDYTEGNGWQYIWLVPHHPNSLIGLLGGDDAFCARLDTFFILEGDLGENAPPDISGLVGQYAHGNEPSHHIAYLYAYAGRQWATAAMVRRLMDEMYTDAPDGLCGNEDVGQMSAWYILSALGFYQVDPSGGPFVFGSPLFDKAEVDLGNGNTFTVISHNNSPENVYVQSVRLNGKKYSRSSIDYADIVGGGTLEFFMGPNPSNFGSAAKDRPHQ